MEKKEKSGEIAVQKILHPQLYNAQLIFSLDKTDINNDWTIANRILTQKNLETRSRHYDLDAKVSYTDDHSFQIKLSRIDDTADLEHFFTKAYSVEFWELYSSDDLHELITSLSQANPQIFRTRWNELNENNNAITPHLGYINLEDSTAFRTLFSDPQFKTLIPGDVKLMFGKSWDSKQLQVYAIKTRGYRDAPLGEKDIKTARQEYTSTGEIEVSLVFNSSGSNKWYLLTDKNVNKWIGICVNDCVISAPRVNAPISGGRVSISGGFNTETEAQDLAFQLTIEKLPIALHLVEKKITKVKPPFLKKANLPIVFLVFFILIALLSYHLFGIVKLPENSTL
jgi:hypothetical protein